MEMEKNTTSTDAFDRDDSIDALYTEIRRSKFDYSRARADYSRMKLLLFIFTILLIVAIVFAYFTFVKIPTLDTNSMLIRVFAWAQEIITGIGVVLYFALLIPRFFIVRRFVKAVECRLDEYVEEGYIDEDGNILIH